MAGNIAPLPYRQTTKQNMTNTNYRLHAFVRKRTPFVMSASFAPDCRSLLTLTVAGRYQHKRQAALLDTEMGACKLRFPSHYGSLTDAVVARTGNIVAAVERDNRLHTTRLALYHVLPLFGTFVADMFNASDSKVPPIWSFVLAPDAQSAVIARNLTPHLVQPKQTRLELWNAQTGGMQVLVEAGVVRCTAFAPNGETFVVLSGPDTSANTAASLRDARTGQEVRAFAGAKHAFKTAAFSPNGRRLATGGDQELIVWNVATGEMLQRYDLPGTVLNLAFTADNTRLICGAIPADNRRFRGELRVWDIEQQRLAFPVQLCKPRIIAAAAYPDSSFAVAACADNTLFTWNLQTGLCVNVVHPPLPGTCGLLKQLFSGRTPMPTAGSDV